MNKLKKQPQPLIYENSLKVAIAREYLTSDLGCGKLGAKYNLSLNTIRHFVRWYRAKYPDGVVPEQTIPPKQSNTDKALKEANL